MLEIFGRQNEVLNNSVKLLFCSLGCWVSALDNLLVRCVLFFLGKELWQHSSSTRASHQSNITGPYHGEACFLSQETLRRC